MRVVRRDNLQVDQMVEDLTAFIEQLEQAADASHKPVKQVATEAIALFRQNNG